jgi:3-hydroxyisobutyrate dehydrogenase-like beta-hydroxyacid dehydrogenase
MLSKTILREITMGQKIAFIGLGLMGSRMAARLIDAGHELTVYNRSRDAARPLADKGAKVADSPGEAAADVDIVMSMVSDDAAVSAVLLGDNGALAGMRPGSTLVDLSSIYPETSREIAKAASERGVRAIDSPVSGSTPAAEQGTLLLMVGGDRAVYDEMKPIVEILGKPVIYMGASGAGTTMKLVVNTLLGVHIQALAEAVAVGEKAGLDKNAILDVLGQTSAVSPAQKAKMENARKQQFSTQFPIRHMHKDLSLVLKLAGEHGVAMPATAVSQQMCAIEAGRGKDEDFSAVLRLMEELSGIEK